MTTTRFRLDAARLAVDLADDSSVPPMALFEAKVAYALELEQAGITESDHRRLMALDAVTVTECWLEEAA